MLVCRGKDIQHTCIYPYRSARARCTAALRSLRLGQSVTWATFILCDEVRCYKEAGQVCERLAAKNGNSRPSWLRKARPCQATIEDPPDTPKHSKTSCMFSRGFWVAGQPCLIFMARALTGRCTLQEWWPPCGAAANLGTIVRMAGSTLKVAAEGHWFFSSAKIPKLMMADSDKCNVKVERWKQLQVHISSH